MPRTPKPPGQRRRRNLSQPAFRQLPADPPRRRAPGLGRKRPPWLKSTREWWERIWASPMAIAWVDGDIPTLQRLARMVDELGRSNESPTALLAEIRQLEDRFGLSPLARRRLQWEIYQGRAGGDDDNPRRPTQLAEVRRLRAVDPDAVART